MIRSMSLRALTNELAPGPGPIGMLVDPNNPNAPADRRPRSRLPPRWDGN